MTFPNFLSFKKFAFWETNQSVLGIDIGGSSIKVVQLRKEKERAILETYGEIALGKYADQDIGRSVKLSDEKIIEALKDIIKESGAASKSAVISIPLRSSFVTAVDLPLIPEKRIDEVVKLEARRYIPVAISEVLLDWLVIPQTDESVADKGKKTTKVLLVATHRDVVAKYKNIASKLNLETKGFEIEIFSIIRSSAGRTNQPVMVIDFGASSAKIIVVDYGMIRLSHSINRGSQDLTMALSRSMGVDFSRAEETKREIGLSPLPEHKELASVMEPELEYIVSEANRVVREYQKKYNRPISRVILTGGGALLNGLVDFSVKRFNMEVGLANPFSKVEYPVFLEEALKKIGPGFSTALGLALREL